MISSKAQSLEGDRALKMTITKIHKSLIFFFCLSLSFALIYGILALKQAFSAQYIIQDDARQHVFWMQRFLEPDLFPDDLIADYFQSVAPWGYTTFYRLFALVGIEPIFLSKILPAILGLIITAYGFGISMQILPVPVAGFIFTTLFNQSLWKNTDDIASATPRAFGACLLIVFLYYLLRYDTRKKQLPQTKFLPSLVVLALMGCFYPQYVFVCVGLVIIRLLYNRQDYWFCAIFLGVAVLIMLPYALKVSDFDPIITAVQAKSLPEFAFEGRASFFGDDLWTFLSGNSRSAMLPKALFTPAILVIGLLLPLLLRLPLGKQITANIAILSQMFLVSVILFFAAHAFLFKLHLPSRYTHYSLRLIIALSAAIALVLLLDAAFRWRKLPKLFALVFAVTVGSLVVFFPLSWGHFPESDFTIGSYPSLYQFFEEQPKDIAIASLSSEADNIPTFAKRSVLVAWEYAIPYQVGYYRQIRQRTTDLIHALYSPELKVLQNFINTYSIDFFLLDRDTYTPKYLTKNNWFRQWENLAEEAATSLSGDTPPIMLTNLDRCSVFQNDNLTVLEAKCLVSKNYF